MSGSQPRPLTPTLALLAHEEVNETPDRIEQDLIILRVWIRQQTHLKARTTEDFLIAFLRRSRYSLEETKKRIDNYFRFYTICPEIMANRHVTERVLEINRTGIHYYPEFPKSDNQSALLIARFGRYDPKKYNIREIMQYVTMVIEIMALESDNAAIAGLCQVIDFAGTTFEHMRQFDPVIYKKWWSWLEECCPLKIKEIFVINSPKEMQRFNTIFKSLLPMNKEFEFTILKSIEDLFKYIPKQCLPEEYGGHNGHLIECIAYMEDLLRSYRDYFAEDNQYGTCEELRSGDIVPYEAEFGVNGSFRKLSNVE